MEHPSRADGYRLGRVLGTNQLGIYPASGHSVSDMSSSLLGLFQKHLKPKDNSSEKALLKEVAFLPNYSLDGL